MEISRWILVIIGFQCAYFIGKTPVESFHILVPWITLSLAGLTGIESVFFGKIASKVTGYAGGGGGYQRQSGINNISVGITGLLVFILDWGVGADAAVMTVLLVFMALSGSNHAYSAFKEDNRNMRNILRPLMSLLLLVFVLPMMIKALTYSG